MPTASARATLDAIIRRHGLTLEFPPGVQREVEEIQRAPDIDDPALDDLTALPFVTIDYPDSMDLDQALHIEREGDGFVVRYALADAAHFVRPGSALLREALRRGVSYYLPGITVPMIPGELSEGLVSLLPGVPRRALVFVMRLDRDGQSTATTLVRARILSRAKLSYAGVQAHFDRPTASPLADQPFSGSLALLREVGERRIADARQRDVIEIDRLETEVELSDPQGTGFALRVQQRNDVSRWNEQISLLCNIEGARLMASRDRGATHVQPVFRVHEPPEPAALERLQRIAARVVAAHGLPPALGRWRRDETPRESLADYLARLRASDAPEPVVTAIERQALITWQRSVFSSEPGQHYALGVSPYARFSAPMREVVGIYTHKEALEKLGLVAEAAPERDEALRERVIDAANAGKERQRRIDKDLLGAFIDQLLAQDLGLPEDRRPSRPGAVLGLRPSRLYVRLDQPPVELKVYAGDLGRPYALEDEIALAPEDGQGRSFTLGDRVALRTVGRDERGRWRLVPAQG